MRKSFIFLPAITVIVSACSGPDVSTRVTSSLSSGVPAIEQKVQGKAIIMTPNVEDITDKGLQDAEKGYRRLMEANTLLQSMGPSNGATSELDAEINDLMDKAFIQMSDDFNTPMAMARLFELVSKVNSLSAGHLSYNDLTNDTLNRLKSTFQTFISDIFGLINEEIGNTDVNGIADGLMQLIIELRQDARENKDWGTSDKIRDSLKELEIKVKDGNDGTTWSKN